MLQIHKNKGCSLIVGSIRQISGKRENPKRCYQWENGIKTNFELSVHQISNNNNNIKMKRKKSITKNWFLMVFSLFIYFLSFSFNKLLLVWNLRTI